MPWKNKTIVLANFLLFVLAVILAVLNDGRGVWGAVSSTIIEEKECDCKAKKFYEPESIYERVSCDCQPKGEFGNLFLNDADYKNFTCKGEGRKVVTFFGSEANCDLKDNEPDRYRCYQKYAHDIHECANMTIPACENATDEKKRKICYQDRYRDDDCIRRETAYGILACKEEKCRKKYDKAAYNYFYGGPGTAVFTSRVVVDGSRTYFLGFDNMGRHKIMTGFNENTEAPITLRQNSRDVEIGGSLTAERSLELLSEYSGIYFGEDVKFGYKDYYSNGDNGSCWSFDSFIGKDIDTTVKFEDECSHRNPIWASLMGGKNAAYLKSSSPDSLRMSGRFASLDRESSDFDNVYMMINNTDNLLDFTGDFSLSFWFRPKNDDIMAQTANDSISEPTILFKKDSFILGFLKPDGGTNQNKGALVLDTYGDRIYTKKKDWKSQWYHVALIRERATTRFYLDGKLDTVANNKDAIRIGSDSAIYVGNRAASVISLGANNSSDKYANSSNLPGYIDEMRFIPKVLTDSEVVDIYKVERSGQKLQKKWVRGLGLSNPERKTGLEMFTRFTGPVAKDLTLKAGYLPMVLLPSKFWKDSSNNLNPVFFMRGLEVGGDFNSQITYFDGHLMRWSAFIDGEQVLYQRYKDN